MPSALKYAVMRSLRNRPTSCKRRLPEASRSARSPGIRCWPAPSATTTTACCRATIRCFNVSSNPRSPSKGKPTSGISVKLTSWLARVAPAAMKPASRPISFTNPMPFHAPRASMCARVDHLAGFFQRRWSSRTIATRRADRCRSSWGFPPPPGPPRRWRLDGDLVRAALGAVAAHAKQNLHPLPLQEIDYRGRILRPARRAEIVPPWVWMWSTISGVSRSGAVCPFPG